MASLINNGNTKDDNYYDTLFAEFDEDNSGSIDSSEFQHLAYAADLVLDEEAVASIIKGLDKDSNGTIDKEEFRTWLNGFDGSEDSTMITRARSALLRAQLFGRSMERKLRVASAKASDVVALSNEKKMANIGFKVSAGNQEDIKMSMGIKVDVPNDAEKEAIGGGAKIEVTLACNEGTTDMQLGKLVGRINTLYELACEKVPMISQFGVLTISPTDCDDGKKGIMLSFVSPNNAVQMMVPTEALPMDPSTILESFSYDINCGFSCEDVMKAADGEAIWDMFTKMLGVEMKGVFNKNALRHAKEVAAAMGAPEPIVKGVGLLANLSICNVTVDFESLQEIIELHPMINMIKESMQGLVNFIKQTNLIFSSNFEIDVRHDLAPLLNMNGDQFKDLYNDFQTTLCGIAKIEATSTLGLHACWTMKNYNFPFAFLPSLEQIDAYAVVAREIHVAGMNDEEKAEYYSLQSKSSDGLPNRM